MDSTFLAWYDKQHPESLWDIEDQAVYDSMYEYIDREQHKQICYQAWEAALQARDKQINAYADDEEELEALLLAKPAEHGEIVDWGEPRGVEIW